jgi:hypothetical protein
MRVVACPPYGRRPRMAREEARSRAAVLCLPDVKLTYRTYLIGGRNAHRRLVLRGRGHQLGSDSRGTPSPVSMSP